MGLLGYRSFTLYDFSNVVKLKIHVFNAFWQTEVATLVAQINPDTITYKVNRQPVSSIIDDLYTGIRRDSYDNNIRFTCDFNIADEYDARTAGGKLPLSINIDDVTIIGDLRKYSASQYISVLKWGPMEEVGRIKDVDCTYKLYSPYGEPLSASVEVVFSVDNDYEAGLFMQSSVYARSLLDKGLVSAAITANYASTQFIPSIVSSARDQEEEIEE